MAIEYTPDMEEAVLGSDPMEVFHITDTEAYVMSYDGRWFTLPLNIRPLQLSTRGNPLTDQSVKETTDQGPFESEGTEQEMSGTEALADGSINTLNTERTMEQIEEEDDEEGYDGWEPDEEDIEEKPASQA
jgi:hypothetical protein